jgi:HAD superfamily hydrolase (TIGR01509 family)
VPSLSGDLPGDVVERLQHAHAQFYRETVEMLRALPGATALLDEVAALGLQVVLATSAPKDELSILRQVFGRDDILSAVSSSADVDAAKPRPDIVGMALQRAGVTADRAVFVGDTIWDIRAAGRASVSCVCAQRRHRPPGTRRRGRGRRIRQPSPTVRRDPYDADRGVDRHGRLTSMKSSLRPAAVLVALVALIAFILTSCPSNRDGAPGQLASAKEEAESACRSGLLALDQWTADRSSAQLVSVQFGDARDQVVKAYKGIATLDTEDPIDLERQQFLTASMTAIITALNATTALVHSVRHDPGPGVLRQHLADAADTLARDYH